MGHGSAPSDFVGVAQAATVAFHLGSEDTTVDLDRFVGEEQARAAEIAFARLALGAAIRGATTLDIDAGLVTYDHDGSETVSDSFTYTIDDNTGSTSNVATVNLTINPQNDPPVAVNDGGSGNEGGSVNLDLAANDSDADDGLDLASIAIVRMPCKSWNEH